MSVLLPIGEFSRMTYLTVKALRHYHEVGVLEPADVDPSSGYRLYSTDQVETALLISRFRDLDMPLDEVRALLRTPDVDERNRIVVNHLQRMEDRLDRTKAAVDSLRAMLSPARALVPPIEVTYRDITPTHALAITEVVEADDCAFWLPAAYAEIGAAAMAARADVDGASGALYSAPFFEQSRGEVTAFVPITSRGAPSGRAIPMTVPGSRYAIAVHHGTFADIDRSYGALGTAVAEAGIGGPGPIRELYPADDITEICWPVTRQPA